MTTFLLDFGLAGWFARIELCYVSDFSIAFSTNSQHHYQSFLKDEGEIRQQWFSLFTEAYDPSSPSLTSNPISPLIEMALVFCHIFFSRTEIQVLGGPKTYLIWRPILRKEYKMMN